MVLANGQKFWTLFCPVSSNPKLIFTFIYNVTVLSINYQKIKIPNNTGRSPGWAGGPACCGQSKLACVCASARIV